MNETIQRGALRGRTWSTPIGAGAVAGLAGGVIFGGLMAMMGMLPMIAGLVGSQHAAVGLGVHLVISTVIGVIYGLLIDNRPGAAAYNLAW